MSPQNNHLQRPPAAVLYADELAKLKQNAHFSNNIVQFKRCLRTQFIDLRQEKPLS